MEGSRQAADQASIAGPSSDSNGLLGKRKREDQGEINPGNTFAQPGTRLASFDPVKDSIDAQPFPYLNGGRGSPRTDQQPSPHMIRTSARGSSSDSSPVSPKSETYPQHNHAAHGGDRKKRQFARRTKTGCLYVASIADDHVILIVSGHVAVARRNATKPNHSAAIVQEASSLVKAIVRSSRGRAVLVKMISACSKQGGASLICVHHRGMSLKVAPFILAADILVSNWGTDDRHL